MVMVTVTVTETLVAAWIGLRTAGVVACGMLTRSWSVVVMSLQAQERLIAYTQYQVQPPERVIENLDEWIAAQVRQPRVLSRHATPSKSCAACRPTSVSTSFHGMLFIAPRQPSGALITRLSVTGATLDTASLSLDAPSESSLVGDSSLPPSPAIPGALESTDSDAGFPFPSSTPTVIVTMRSPSAGSSTSSMEGFVSPMAVQFSPATLQQASPPSSPAQEPRTLDSRATRKSFPGSNAGGLLSPTRGASRAQSRRTNRYGG